jgi:glutamine synthetase
MSAQPTFAVPGDFTVDPEKLAGTRQALEAAGVKFCFATYVDIHGVPKAKATPIDAFEKMAHGSELFTVGAMEGMGLVGPHEDECAAVPDLDTMLVCPWDRRHAWFFGDLYYHGVPYPHDSRVILKRQLDRAAKLGLQLNLGMETEFYVMFVDAQTGERRILQRDRYEGTCPAYDAHLTFGAMDFLEPMSDAMKELGWGLYSFDQEGGHSQFEFDFQYADALTMCDRFVFLRTMAKNLAAKIGATAIFIPKPFANDFRSADHFNMSLASLETGENLFAPQPGEDNPFAAKYGSPMAKLAYHYAAGILRHAPALTAVTSPTYNSYQGLIAQGDMPDISWAPVMMAWGNNNRSAMLRFPPNRWCVENRTPDIACNPYLAAAVQLAAGLEGIEQQLDPGPPLDVNCYDLSRAQLRAAGVRLLPRTLLHALEAFEEDALIGEVFGDFKEIYYRQKLKEWDEGFYAINEAHLRKRLTFI